MRSLPLPLALASVLALSACARRPAFPVAHAYAVRGRVVKLPEPGKPFTAFYLSHEAIPEFRDAEGAKVGMPAMVMSFDCSDPSLLAPLAVGDKVRMEIAVSKDLVDWDVLRIEKLPPGTPLELADGVKDGAK